MVPDRDPVEVECLDSAPEIPQLRDRRVLQAGVHAEANVHANLLRVRDVRRDLRRDQAQMVVIVEIEDL